MKILSIDLGGSSAKIALFNGDKITKRWKIKTDLENIWKNIKDNLNDISEKEYECVGLSMPGFIDHEKGIVKLSGNLGLKDYDVKKHFSKYFNKPVFILNDANAAALGEYWKGAASQDSSTIFYTIGTGIGGGIVVDGKLIYGKNGYAGELGHGGYFQDKWPCTCGLKNCVEPVSSATGIQKSLNEKADGIKLPEAGVLLSQGDQKIKEIFKESLRPLAMHISTMQTAINPDSIIIGGGPSSIGEPLRKIIEDLVYEYQLDFIAKSTKIRIASTQNDAGIYGAAYWATKRIKKI